MNLLFSFSGRINRAKYWLAVVIWLAILVVSVVISLIAVGTSGIDWSDPSSVTLTELLRVGIGPVVFLTVVGIVSLVSTLAFCIKRLHDRDKSGWWVLLFLFVPGILDGIGSTMGTMSFVFSIAAVVVAIWGLIEFGFLRGTKGPNDYGPDPLPAQA